MRIVGWCVRCKRVRRGRIVGPGQIHVICDDCDAEEEGSGVARLALWLAVITVVWILAYESYRLF